jgi:hypothetical protein
MHKKTIFITNEEDGNPIAIAVDGEGIEAYEKIYNILKEKHPLYAEACQQEAECYKNEDDSPFSPAQGLQVLVEDVGAYTAYTVNHLFIE